MPKIKTVYNIIRHNRNWLPFFADYLGIIKSRPLLYKMRNGVSFIIHPGGVDNGIINEIWFYRFYTPQHFEIKERDIIVDIGAQIGVFSIFASRLAKEGKVFSYEPNPENFRYLVKNLSLNKSSNVIPVNQAVSDKEGKATMYIHPTNIGMHSLISRPQGSRKTYQVNTTSLDAIVRKNGLKRIDFLKMDCEGAEYRVLFGCSKKTLKIIQKISLEHHDNDCEYKVIDLMRHLEKNGFAVMINPKNRAMLHAIRKS